MTEHAADGPFPLSAQLLPPANVPGVALKLTVPVGALAPGSAGLVTVAVHVEVCCASTAVGEHATLIANALWNSKAPMSQLDSPTPGRGIPRWSVPRQLATGM